MSLALRLGYDGPVKVWVDGTPVFHDPAGSNPARIDAATTGTRYDLSLPWIEAYSAHLLEPGEQPRLKLAIDADTQAPLAATSRGSQ